MANPGYVRSTDGNNSNNGSTWALANATLAGAITDAAAGDTIYSSQAHSEATGSAITLTFPGTLASPNKIIGANDAAEPPTAVSTAPSVATSASNSGITISGSLFCYGHTFTADTTAANSTSIITIGGTADSHQTFKDCLFYVQSTGSSSRLSIGSSNRCEVVLRDCTLRLSATGQHALQMSGNGSTLRWLGGGLHASGSAITAFMTAAGGTNAFSAEISGVDLASAAAGVNLVTIGSYSGRVVFRDCKMPASWSGGLISAAITTPEFYVELWNCDSADTNYRLWTESYYGSVKSETTIVRTGGASDGVTPLAWKIVSSANAAFANGGLRSPEIVVPNDAVGSSKTITVEIVTDNVTLTDAECWLEIMHLGTSGFPLGAWASDAKTDFLATAANQTSSSVTWTTTGLTTPVKQKLTVTFTPQEKGFVHCVVRLGKASTTVYVCPKAEIS